MKKTMMTIVTAMLMFTGLTGCAGTDSMAPKSADYFPKMPYETIGVYVVMDVSGSMSESVLNSKGQPESKFNIANRSLIALGNRLDAYLMANKNRSIAIGIVTLGGYVKLNSRDYLTNGVTAFFKTYIKDGRGPGGGTPIGEAMAIASQDLVVMKIKAKHIVVITDGANTDGPTPQKVMPRLQSLFIKSGTPIGIHFVALDVNSSTFKEVEKLGGTVVGADNEVQLNEKLDYILSEKILLERED